MELESHLFIQLLLTLYIVYYFFDVQKIYRVFLIVFLLAFTANMLDFIIYGFKQIPAYVSNFIFVVYSLLGFSGVLLFLKLKFKDKIINFIFYAGVFVLISTVLIRDIYFGMLFSYSSSIPIPLLGTIFITAACLRALYLFLKRADDIDLYRKLDFWIVISVLFFYIIQFVFIGFLNVRMVFAFNVLYFNELFHYSSTIYYFVISLLIVNFGRGRGKIVFNRKSNSING